MAAAKLKLRIEQGATFTKPLLWKNKDSGTPIDLTGCIARMQVRASIKSATVLLSLTTENDRITLGDAAGTILLELTAEETAAITWTSAVYDLEIVFPNATVRRLAEGSIAVIPEVTRD